MSATFTKITEVFRMKPSKSATTAPDPVSNSVSDSVFIPHSNPTLPLSVTVDRMGRICLSAEFRRKIGFPAPSHVQLYVSYDKVNRRIGLAKTDIIRLVGVRPYNFDKRGYTYAKRFLLDNEIPFDVAYNYEYDGVEDTGSGAGWHAFRLVGYVAPDKPTIE